MNCILNGGDLYGAGNNCELSVWYGPWNLLPYLITSLQEKAEATMICYCHWQKLFALWSWKGCGGQKDKNTVFLLFLLGRLLFRFNKHLQKHSSVSTKKSRFIKFSEWPDWTQNVIFSLFPVWLISDAMVQRCHFNILFWFQYFDSLNDFHQNLYWSKIESNRKAWWNLSPVLRYCQFDFVSSRFCPCCQLVSNSLVAAIKFPRQMDLPPSSINNPPMHSQNSVFFKQR